MVKLYRSQNIKINICKASSNLKNQYQMNDLEPFFKIHFYQYFHFVIICFDFLTNCHIIINVFQISIDSPMIKLYRSQKMKMNLCKASSNLESQYQMNDVDVFLGVPFC